MELDLPEGKQCVALFCGSRDWEDDDAVYKALSELPDGSLVIVGDATGADEIVRRIECNDQDNRFRRLADEKHLELEVHHADWDVHGRAAGPIRNREMLERRPDVVFAFQHDRSRGTQFTIRTARQMGIPVTVIRGAS